MKLVPALLLIAATVARAQAPTTLSYSDASARTVAVAGDFTGGMPQAMTRDATGKWSKTVFLQQGTYSYRFLVNGSKWILDPNNSKTKKIGTTEYSVIVAGEVAASASDATLTVTASGPVTLGDVVVEPMRLHVFEIPVSESAWKKASTLPRPDCDNALPAKPATRTVKVGLCVPNGFDPSKPYPLLIVSSTINRPCIELWNLYASPAAQVGWVSLAADAPSVPTEQRDDSNAYRWAMIVSALDYLHTSWPASRNWPTAAGGFSGGGARSGYVAALLMKSNYHLIGMWLGGINADCPTWGSQLYGIASPSYQRVPIFFSYGTHDTICTPQMAREGLGEIKKDGYKRVRAETYEGGHDPSPEHIKAGLEWFVAESKN